MFDTSVNGILDRIDVLKTKTTFSEKEIIFTIEILQGYYYLIYYYLLYYYLVQCQFMEIKVIPLEHNYIHPWVFLSKKIALWIAIPYLVLFYLLLSDL